MYANPCSEADGTFEFMPLLPDRRHRGVAPDHRHDSLVVIVKRSSSFARDLGHDVLRGPCPTLLCHRAQLRQGLVIGAGNIREVPQYVNTGEALNREVRPHINPSAMPAR